MSEQFLVRQPSLENSWRSIILFGRNVASYKFALGKSLLELAAEGKESVPLEELAVPFSRHLCEHLEIASKQGTFGDSSRFLEACRKFNRSEISHQELISTTVSLGFNNVIDAFHVVGQGEAQFRFYEDERKQKRKGIRIREEVFKLCSQAQAPNLTPEIEARWRLVETAWGLSVPVATIKVGYEADGQEFIVETPSRRESITGARDAISGYQKGGCFYCGSTITVTPGSDTLADVDHLVPHCLMEELAPRNLDGVWNLVLACKDCNRGTGGKFDTLPDIRFLAQLHQRNEYYISSHHPLRETIINQTGSNKTARHKFLDHIWNDANDLRPTAGHWTPEYNGYEGI